MNAFGNQPANITLDSRPVEARGGDSDADVFILTPRRPGAPVGRPKPPGSGRKAGVRNRVNREIAERVRKHDKEIVEGLLELFRTAPDAEIRLKTGSLLLSYGHGSPVSRREVSGPQGQPIQQITTNIAADAENLSQALGGTEPEKALAGPALDAAKTVAFARELARRQEKAETPRDDGGRGLLARARSVVPPTPPIFSASENPISESEIQPPQPPPPGCFLRFIGSPIYISGLPGDRPGLPDIFEARDSTGLMRRGSFEIALAAALKAMGGSHGPWTIEQPRQQQQAEIRPDQMPPRSTPPAINTRRPR